MLTRVYNLSEKLQAMIVKNAKTILFASLIAAIILPVSGMNFADAEDAYKTDEQLIVEFDELFGDPRELEAKKSYSDVGSAEFAFLNEVPDYVKIDVMKNLALVEEKAKENSEYKENFKTEQNKVHESANKLVELIQSAEDPVAKESLENALLGMKDRMAEVGIFLPEDKDNEELNDKFFRNQEDKQNTFKESTTKDVSFDSEQRSETIPASHNPYTYRVDTTVKYVCGFLVCSVNPQIDYVYQSNSIVHTGAIGSHVGFGSWGEWFHKLTNLQHAPIYQGTYHQGIHYDSSWNYKDGEASYANFLYPAGANHDINHFTTSASVNPSDKTYSYLYIGP